MKALLASLLLSALALAGCSDAGSTPQIDQLAEEVPEIEVTDSTGGIRGVVVDEAVRPIAGASIRVEGASASARSDDNGLFALSGLEAGSYVVEATHQLYDTMRQTIEVRAGVADPPAAKFQLTRVIFAQPYLTTIKYDGFIVCSTNVGVPNAGYLLSEECGEGVGVPGVGRVGGQGNNAVQFDFTIENENAKSIVIEQAWEPTSDAGRGLYSPVSFNWVCDPGCSGETFAELNGESPTYLQVTGQQLQDLELTPEKVISIFTWASFTGTTGASMTLNQPYQNFVTISYHLPLPADWSFVGGDPNPFE